MREVEGSSITSVCSVTSAGTAKAPRTKASKRKRYRILGGGILLTLVDGLDDGEQSWLNARYLTDQLT